MPCRRGCWEADYTSNTCFTVPLIAFIDLVKKSEVELVQQKQQNRQSFVLLTNQVCSEDRSACIRGGARGRTKGLEHPSEDASPPSKCEK